jgi:hypothetical protein
MACPSLLRGIALRATRLDSCGRPLYGDCNAVVSDGFVTVKMSAETQDSDDITVTKANGQTCINEAGCEQLSYYGTEIDFCEVDPDLVSIMNPSFEIYRDADGNPIGWDDSVELRCDVGFALEVWTGVYAGDDACSGAGSQGEWGYLLLPWVTGGAMGDLEITNDAVSFAFNGKTKVGTGWGRGPYNVQAGPGGIPGRMLKPIGPKVPRRFFLTTIRPPEPECGCQPVDRPIPDPADLYITGVANETPRKSVRFRADNHGFGPLLVTWGDSTPQQEVPDGAWVTHTYAADGEHTITAADKQTPVITASRDITIPLPADEPTLTVSVDDEDRFTISAVVDLPSQASGTATVDWGDGTDPQDATVGAGGTVIVEHTYTVPGVYTITVRRGDIDTYRTRQTVLVPVADPPTASAVEDPADGTGMTAKLTWDNTGQGTVSIAWGDASGPLTAAETGTASHAYTAAGTYTIRVTSSANPLAYTDVPVTVPFA